MAVPADTGVELENLLEGSLRASSMADWAHSVVIDPELEVWVFSDSPHVASALGWQASMVDLRAALTAQDLWHEEHVKPRDPKTTVEWALRQARKPRSSSIYRELARRVSLDRCEDRSFLRLKGLLAAVSAPQSDEIEKMKMELLRLRFDEQVRSEKRKSAGTAIESAAAGLLKPWREVVTPHTDVASGRYQQAEFAADLWQVHLGEGTDEYRDPVEFFRRTYLTESLKHLLVGAVRRLMAAVIHSLWEKGDRNPLIQPANLPIDDPRVQFELTRYLSDNWVPVIEKDVDGPSSLPLRLDGEVPNLGKFAACRTPGRMCPTTWTRDWWCSASTTHIARRRGAGRIADEVIAHLAGLVGSTVKVTLEIEAEIPSGAPENVVRTVTENSWTLKFTSHGFEAE